MSYSFSTMSSDELHTELKDKFIEDYEGTLISKEPFTVELDDKEIKLHLFIEDIDMSDYEDSNDHIISIGVMPAFESLSDKNQNNIISQYTPDEQESIRHNKEALLEEVKSYGYTITLHSETVSGTDASKVQEVFDTAVTVSPCVSGLIGFDLDRIFNRLGNTGWDILNEYCCDVDRLQAALERYKGE